MDKPLSEMSWSELIDETVKLQQRNAALAVHVEAGRQIISHGAPFEVVGGGRTALAVNRDAAMNWERTAPTTSLARMRDERAQAIQQAVKRARMEWAREDKAELDRLKARWQAEALDSVMPQIRGCAREVIYYRVQELRRQAEGGGHAD